MKENTNIRSPVCIVMGHVDHGKTTILDFIRGTAIARGEAGGITQAISSTNLSIKVIQEVCGDLLNSLKTNITLPGILFIDSPGHAAFTNLRKRGGNIADIAILTIDINEGLKPQTIESIEILKKYKTPFIIAANKIDVISGWNSKADKTLLSSIQKQSENTKDFLDKKLYELVGQIYEIGFNSQRFDRVEDYTKEIAIIPLSAKTGEGIPELLMVLTGLAQKFLENCLECNLEKEAKGTILEVKEEKGIGTTLDAIIYDGTLKKGDTIIIGNIDEPIVTKVKALFEPGKKQLKAYNEVRAAIGVKISAPDIKEAIPGMPIISVKNKADINSKTKEIQKEIDEILIETDNEGIILKADSLGSLEALVSLVKEKKIPIKKASIGNVTKKDVADALSEKNEINKVILAFNTKPIETKEIKIISNEIIYKLLDDLEEWRKDEQSKIERKKLKGLVKPAKFMIMHNCIFRQSNPAVFGVEILSGILETGTPIMKSNGKKVNQIDQLQKEGENVNSAEKGEQLAVAVKGIIIGRQVIEGEILFSDISEKDFLKYKELKSLLKPDETQILKEIAGIKRRDNPVWGV